MVCKHVQGGPLVSHIKFQVDWSMFGGVKGHFLFWATYFLCAGDVLQTCSGQALGLTYQVLGRLVNVWRS